jgi:hypothetical protein
MEAAMLEVAAIPVRATPRASVTDMSPQLAEVVARSGAHARVEVLRTPVPRPPSSSGTPPTDHTLRAGQAPMLAPPAARVPMWIAVLVAVVCLAAGFLAGFVAGRP